MQEHSTPDQTGKRQSDVPVSLDDDLEQIGDLFAALRAEASVPLDEQTIVGFVQASVSAALEQSASEPIPSTHVERERSLLGALRIRLAAFAAGVAVFVGSIGGVAVAADDAKPGDALYGIDRALEAVGIGDGNAEERLAEAGALIDAGQVPRGLRHAAEAVSKDEPTESQASTALEEAADRVRSSGSEQSSAVREQVAGLLTYLADNAGQVNGQEVAELAREIGQARQSGEETPGGAESPGNRPVEPPGQSESGPETPGNPHGEPPGQTKDKPEHPEPPNRRP